METQNLNDTFMQGVDPMKQTLTSVMLELQALVIDARDKAHANGYKRAEMGVQ